MFSFITFCHSADRMVYGNRNDLCRPTTILGESVSKGITLFFPYFAFSTALYVYEEKFLESMLFPVQLSPSHH